MRVTVPESRLPELYAAIRSKLKEMFGPDAHIITVENFSHLTKQGVLTSVETRLKFQDSDYSINQISKIFQLERLERRRLVGALKNAGTSVSLDELVLFLIKAKVYIPAKKIRKRH